MSPQYSIIINKTLGEHGFSSTDIYITYHTFQIKLKYCLAFDLRNRTVVRFPFYFPTQKLIGWILRYSSTSPNFYTSLVPFRFHLFLKAIVTNQKLTQGDVKTVVETSLLGKLQIKEDRKASTIHQMKKLEILSSNPVGLHLETGLMFSASNKSGTKCNLKLIPRSINRFRHILDRGLYPYFQYLSNRSKIFTYGNRSSYSKIYIGRRSNAAFRQNIIFMCYNNENLRLS